MKQRYYDSLMCQHYLRIMGTTFIGKVIPYKQQVMIITIHKYNKRLEQ